MLLHERPPSVVRSSDRHAVAPQGAVPSTQPTSTDTKVTDCAAKPGGTGPTGRGGPGVGSGVAVVSCGLVADGMGTAGLSVARGLPPLASGSDEHAVSRPTAAAVASAALTIVPAGQFA